MEVVKITVCTVAPKSVLLFSFYRNTVGSFTLEKARTERTWKRNCSSMRQKDVRRPKLTDWLSCSKVFSSALSRLLSLHIDGTFSYAINACVVSSAWKSNISKIQNHVSACCKDNHIFSQSIWDILLDISSSNVCNALLCFTFHFNEV